MILKMSSSMLLVLLTIAASAPGQTSSGVDAYPEILCVGQKEWLCTWVAELAGGSASVTAGVVISRSSDNGKTWSPPARIDQLGHRYGQFQPSISRLESGNLVLEMARTRVESSDRGLTWKPVAEPWRLPEEQTLSYLGDAVQGADGVIARLLSRGSKDTSPKWHLSATISRDSGQTWDAPVDLSDKFTGNCPDCFVLASDAAGRWLAIWADHSELFWVTSTDNARTWSAPAIFWQAPQHEYQELRELRLTQSKSSCCLVTWVSSHDAVDYEAGPSYVRARRSTDFGATWQEPMLLNKGLENNYASTASLRAETDHKGTWIATWQTLMPWKDGQGVQRGTDICHAISDDDARTWSPPAALNSNSKTDFGSHEDCSIATNGEGTWITVWHSNDSLGGKIGRDTDILCTVSNDNGHTWSKTAPLNTNAATDTDDKEHLAQQAKPAVATDGKGLWLMAWRSQAGDQTDKTGLDSELYVARSRDNGETWTPPVVVNSDAVSDLYDEEASALAVNDAGIWVAAWERWNSTTFESKIAVARSDDDGKTWSPPQDVSTDGCLLEQASIVSGRKGTWALAYQDANEPGGRYSVNLTQSTDDGRTWAKPVPLGNTERHSDHHPRLAVSQDGIWGLAWMGYVNQQGVIFLKTSRDNKTWSETAAAQDVSNHRTWAEPSLAAGKPGQWLLCAANEICSSSDDGSHWSKAEPVLPQGDWILASGGTQCWLAMENQSSRYNDKPLHLRIFGSSDNGRTWSERRTCLPLDEQSIEADAAIANDKKGKWIAAWSSGRRRKDRQDYWHADSADWRVEYIRSGDNGTTWSEPVNIKQ